MNNGDAEKLFGLVRWSTLGRSGIGYVRGIDLAPRTTESLLLARMKNVARTYRDNCRSVY